MQNNKPKYQFNFKLPNWTVPIFFLLETLIAYGFLAGLQGFYFDDWPMVWQIQSGANFWEFYSYDRPFSAWTLYLTAPILHTNALTWHLFTILMRWLTTWLAWYVLNLIWPKQKRIITLSAILFAVYPAFLQMPIAVAYSQHFITYLLFLLSFAFMLLSLRGNKTKFWLFTLLGLSTQGLHLFTMEYFWGLEFLRLLALFFYFAQENLLPLKDRVYKTIKVWLPYLLMFIAAVVWRLYIYSPVEDPNELRLLDMFRSDPFNVLIHFIEIILKDTLQIIILAWERTLRVNFIDLQNNFLSIVWVIVGAVCVGVIVYFRTISFKHDPDESSWRKELFIFGLATVLLGPLPAWLTNKQVTIGMYSDRFALAGMLGASILLVIFFDWVLSNKEQAVVAVAILTGLAVGMHLRTGNDYRWAWINQQRFYWQMHWRIPALEENTAIFSDGAIFQYTGDYPTAFALNLLYSSDDQGQTEFPYWFFELDRGFYRYSNQYLKGKAMEGELRNIKFEGWSLDSILIDYDAIDGNCLWVVGAGDETIYSLPTITQSALPLSNLDRIKPVPDIAPNALFGPELEHTWCYYFQKAELARQTGNWQRLNELTEEVTQKGLRPQNNFEWRAFLDGYLHNGKYNLANSLSLQIYESKEETHDMVCDMWIGYTRENPEDKDLLEYAELTEDQLRCKW